MNSLARWVRFEQLSGEWRLCLACNRWAGRRVILPFFRSISRIGDGAIWYGLMIGIAILGGARGWQAALHMAATAIVAALLYRTLKHWTRRPRPFRTHRGIIAHIPPLDEFSFPSGHTLHAVTFSLIAIEWYPALALLLLPLTALIGLSRVLLGLHYPSDVLVATAIGFLLAEISISCLAF